MNDDSKTAKDREGQEAEARERIKRYRAEQAAVLWQEAKQVQVRSNAYAIAAEFAERERVTVDEAASILIDWGTRPYPPRVCPGCHSVGLGLTARCLSCGFDNMAPREDGEH